MRKIAGEMDVKTGNRIRTMKFLLERGSSSRQELAMELGFSMPTIFQIVNDLMEKGLIYEAGEYGSTGGRRAKILMVNPDAFCVAGVVVTQNQVRMIIMNSAKKIVDSRYVQFRYEDTAAYYTKFGELVTAFLESSRAGVGPLLGVGLAMPGIIDLDSGRVRRSLILNMTELSLEKFTQRIAYPTCFVSTKNEILAEVDGTHQNAIYLFLGDSVGGGAYLDGQVYKGDMEKPMLFGHITVVRDGKKCYCGKNGCLNAYCSAGALCEASGMELDDFFAALERKDSACEAVWDEYLEYLALAIANLRMIFDCKVILGGKISRHLGEYMLLLEEKVSKNVLFDKEMSFITLGKYGSEVGAVGAALTMLETCIEEGTIFQTGQR